MKTVDATERTRFSKINIGQGQRSLHATHPVMLLMICAKYGKNASRIVHFCDHGKYGNNRSRTENVTERKTLERTRFSKSRSNDIEDIGQGQRSSHATHLLMPVIICTKYGKDPSRTVGLTERQGMQDGRTDRRTGWKQYTPQQLCCVEGKTKGHLSTHADKFEEIR